MGTELAIDGAIVDSWVEPAGSCEPGCRVVLQVQPKGRPLELLIVEADMGLIPDRNWLEDLSENLCHGSPVAAIGRLTVGGLLSATHLQLAR